jgi:transposase
VKTVESQELRLLLTNRKTLQTSRVTLENEIRGTLKAFGSARQRGGNCGVV